MTSRPWYAHYPSDYARDTAHLSMLEHGAYYQLLNHYYFTGIALPLEIDKLARIIRANSPEEIAAIEKVLADFFHVSHGRYHQKRADKEIARANQLTENKRKAGSAGGVAARGKSGRKPNSETIADPIADELQNNAQLQSHTQDSTLSQENTQSQKESVLFVENSTVAAREKVPVGEAFDAYNEVARKSDWPVCKTRTAQRQQRLRSRLKNGGLEAWRAALDRAAASDFCCGRAEGHNGTTFVADIDFLLQESSHARLMEGRYDNRPAAGNGNGSPATGFRNGRSGQSNGQQNFTTFEERGAQRYRAACRAFAKGLPWDKDAGPAPPEGDRILTEERAALNGGGIHA